ncbi:uncharacterized protein LOC123305721 [Chrysoperla carnea]|uniref:uncharacterized protein LOC123305721 n=1 Tax=Chrysoperla carnea TaxID=189513 RepID=UPI001D08E9DE|nr:uncharacterized protein LOC123305721 [Chrysoperla carnea]
MKPHDLTIWFFGVFVILTQFYVIFSLPPFDDKLLANAIANATVNSTSNSTLESLKSATNSTKLNSTSVANSTDLEKKSNKTTEQATNSTKLNTTLVANSTDLEKKSNKTTEQGNGKQLVSVYDLYGASIPSAVIIAPPNVDGYVVSTGEGGSNFATLRPINAPAPNVWFSDGWFNWPFSCSWPDIFPFL